MMIYASDTWIDFYGSKLGILIMGELNLMADQKTHKKDMGRGSNSVQTIY